MKRSWIKLYLEILDDPKMGQMPDYLWRRAIELFLLAGENGNDGLLPPVSDMAWRLRVKEGDLNNSLRTLSQIGVVHETPEGWVVTHFAERQAKLSDAERASQYRERQRHGVVTDGVTKSDRERVTDSSSLSESFSDSGGEGAGRGGIPPPRSASDGVAVSEFLDQDPGKAEAQRVLLQASQLAALPPSEYARVEQVRAMIATYGAEKTLAELRAQRGKWCKTRGRNGKFYSPLNMGWVDRADQALAEGATPQEAPYDPMAPYYRYLERKALEEKNGAQDGST